MIATAQRLAQRLVGIHANRSQSRRSRFWKFATIHTAIVVLFVMMVLGAYQVSRNRRARTAHELLSNGTSSFAPTTILISLDGFRADFLQRGLTPTLNALIEAGVSPKYMLPSFPSVTFPNHFTLVTGLYPESHGVVGNTFWDPELEEEFFYTDPARSMQSKWWQAEPVWNTAEKAGIRSAIHMWPGSEALIGGIMPTFLDKYNATEVLSRKVDRILQLLDLPGDGEDSGRSTSENQRPQFVAAYVPNIDADGHKYGPNSTEIRNTIENVDGMLHDLFAGLKQRNLTDIVNVVIVSDHGMSTVTKVLQLEDLIDLDLVEHIDGWPLQGLRPKDPMRLRVLYDRLTVESANNPNFEVYLRDEDMPERYHFAKNKRIAPLWIVPKTGVAIVEKEVFDVKKAEKSGEVYHPLGLHGYDHEHPLMRAIFIARGPAFPHKPNSRVEVFQNVEVYNIICDSLRVPPRPNNGTLRLPLTPVGLHADEGVPAPDLLADPSHTGHKALSTEAIQPTATIGVDIPDIEPTRPVVHDSNAHNADENEKKHTSVAWWTYIVEKYEAAKGWALGIISHSEDDHSQSGSQ